MAESIYVRTLSVILVYKLVYYFLHFSVMDKQLRGFEVIMHILCSVLGGACVTLMDRISFLRTEVLFKFFLSLRGWIVVVFVPNYHVEGLVSLYQQFVLNMSLFFCTHRPSLFPILTFDIMLTNSL